MLAKRSFTGKNISSSLFTRAGQPLQSASMCAHTLRRRQRLQWVVAIVSSMLALFPLMQANPVAAKPHITEFKVPPSYRIGIVLDITAGADGALWFTAGSNVIGRITTQGVVTTQKLPERQYNATRITMGPEKALWFTLPNRNPRDTHSEIGRLTTGGAFTAFPIPYPSSPYDITTGPDGNIYFTDTLFTGIDRITPQGKISLFPTLSVFDAPLSIAPGPDGNLWFTESYGQANKIGRITTQ